jgi:hypothetical protein
MLKIEDANGMRVVVAVQGSYCGSMLVRSHSMQAQVNMDQSRMPVWLAAGLVLLGLVQVHERSEQKANQYAPTPRNCDKTHHSLCFAYSEP